MTELLELALLILLLTSGGAAGTKLVKRWYERRVKALQDFAKATMLALENSAGATAQAYKKATPCKRCGSELSMRVALNESGDIVEYGNCLNGNCEWYLKHQKDGELHVFMLDEEAEP